MADDIKNLEKQNKLLKEQRAIQESIAKIWQKIDQNIDGIDLRRVNQSFSEADDKLDEIVKTIKNLNLKQGFNVKHLGAYTKEANELKTMLSSMSLEGLDAKEVNHEIGALFRRLASLQAKVEGSGSVAVDAFSNMKDGVGSFGDIYRAVLSGSPKQLKAAAAGAGGVADSLEKAGIKAGSLPGIMKLIGGSAKGFGAVLGGVSKIFASWPGMLMMGVVALGKIVAEADQVVKDANKGFALIRGPDIMTKDVKKQFQEFNRQIYSTADNIRTGLDVTQIRSLMEAMTSAGLNITRLNEGLLEYRDAIFISAKASKALGTDIAWVGAKIGDMITDFRMNMETIDKTFIQVAFDAKKSGVSTDRFWSAIQNATSSMALYGVFMGAASKTMKRFTEDMVGGAKDAEEATGDMFGIFKSGSLEGQAAVLDFAKNAGANISDMFKKMSSDFEGKALNIKARIENLEGEKQTEEVRDQLQKLRSEYSDYQSKNMRYSKMVGRNSVVQASEMAALAGDAPEILLSAVRGIAQVGDLTQVSGERMLVAVKAGNEMGVSEKTIRMLVEQAKMTKEKINMLAKDSVKYFDSSKLKDKNTGKTIAAKLKETLEAEGQEQIKQGDELAALMAQSLKMPPDQAKMFAEMAMADKVRGVEMADLLANGNEKSVKALLGIMESSGILNDFQAFKFKQDEKAQDELEKNAEENLKNIVKETLSLKEMADIAKSEVNYRLSSLGFMRGISDTAGDILGWLLRSKPIMTESQKAAQKMAVASINQDESLKGLLKLDGDNNITAKSQQVLTGEIVEKIAGLNKKISAQRYAARILEEAGTAEANQGKGSHGAGLNVVETAMTNIRSELVAAEKAKKDSTAFRSKEQIAALKDQLDILEKMRTEIKKAPADQKKKIAALAEKNAKILKEAELQKGKLEDIKTNLVTMNKTNQTIADFTEAQVLSDPKAMAVIADQISAEFGQGGTSYRGVAEKVTGKYGANVARGLATTQREDSAGVKTDIFTPSQKVWLESAAIAAEESKQGLKIPEMVTAPGSVILHPGETILPKGYENIGTLPVQQTAEAKGTAGGQKTININVTATERDLAQKIANEIRSVMYNDHIPN